MLLPRVWPIGEIVMSNHELLLMQLFHGSHCPLVRSHIQSRGAPPLLKAAPLPHHFLSRVQ
eukprot:1157390-Pelagomonas_calceolata.AAC.4